MRLKKRIFLFMLGFLLLGYINVVLYHYRKSNLNKISVKDIVKCVDKELSRTIRQRGGYYVFYNYVRAESQFKCDESITFTAPADYRFLDNLVDLVKVWNGPISVSLYAPGFDFKTTLDTIAYLRVCKSSKIKELVTFHLFTEVTHLYIQKNSSLLSLYEDKYDCTNATIQSNSENMYKTKKKLLYPINVARNIAKEAATTHFILPADIELIPSKNLTEKFLKFVTINTHLFLGNSRNVFVLPIFEIEAGETIPENKTRLLAMMKKKKAFLFHQKICAPCHRVIKGNDWLKAEESDGLGIFVIGKRYNASSMWEPFFISVQDDTFFDERLSWEGQANKMTQVYSLCLLDYNFVILDNAFLVHKPGIKKKKLQNSQFLKLSKKTVTLLKYSIAKELIQLYGGNSKCKIF